MQDGIQRYARTKMVLPLRVWLDEQGNEPMAAHLAHTVDTCDIGCRLGGLRTELSPGQIITVQRGQHKASFRVIWSKRLAPNENQAGIEAVDQGVNIWAINPAPPQVEPPRVAAAPQFAAPVVSQPVPSIEQKSLLAAAHRRFKLAVSLGFLFLILGVGTAVYHQVFYESGRVDILPLLPTPPTAWQLARLTPKPHPMPTALTKPLDASATRLQVAEAPTGHVVYPVPPDESITGKVSLQIVIATNGLVKQIHVLSGKQPLAEAAAEAVRLWHYGSFQGAERETSVTVSFLGADAVSLEFPSSNGLFNSSRSKND